MKVAYCQISNHHAFVGVNGNYYEEPFIDKDGPLLTLINNNSSIIY